MEYRNVTAPWLTLHRIQGSKSKFSKTKNPKSNTDLSVLGDWTYFNSTSFRCRRHGRPAIPHAHEICYSGSFSVSACTQAAEGRWMWFGFSVLCTRATFVHFAFINKMSTSGWVPFVMPHTTRYTRKLVVFAVAVATVVTVIVDCERSVRHSHNFPGITPSNVIRLLELRDNCINCMPTHKHYNICQNKLRQLLSVFYCQIGVRAPPCAVPCSRRCIRMAIRLRQRERESDHEKYDDYCAIFHILKFKFVVVRNGSRCLGQDVSKMFFRLWLL